MDSPNIENYDNLRIPPHDYEAEQAVIGSILLDNEAVYPSMELLTGEDFYSPQLKVVFEAISDLYRSGVAIDVITLKNRLEEKSIFEESGGLKLLATLSNFVPSAVNVRNYIKIVKDKSILRRLIKTSQELGQLAYDGTESISSILDKTEKNIFNILEENAKEGFSHIRDVTYASIERIEEIYNNKKKITGIETGFPDFDNMTAGLQKSDLVLVAARPSMGKTAFTLNIAQNAAVKGKIPTAIFSLEMSKEQLATRLLSSEAMVDSQRIRTGDLNDEDWSKLIEAMGILAEAPLYIDDTPGITPMEIRSKCRKLKMEKGLGLIVVDYIQLMSSNGKNDSRQQEISEISRSLKAIAREMDAPVIALSQLSRACDQRTDHRPVLSDLRESGAIEQDADVVTFLYRDEYYFPETEKKNLAELIIAKQRNGPTGTIELMWFGQYTRFRSIARR
ncbi:MAG: replicative DNA helicase [Lachnospiraceae bacterium]|nr:replicative DNA helicase [Lachnospiraceae bacterium]